jgi:hypothetical protein
LPPCHDWALINGCSKRRENGDAKETKDSSGPRIEANQEEIIIKIKRPPRRQGTYGYATGTKYQPRIKETRKTSCEFNWVDIDQQRVNQVSKLQK